MITTEVTLEQIKMWKKIYSEDKDKLTVNRISGKELNYYFIGKYHPVSFLNENFEEVVRANAKEMEGAEETLIVTYKVDGDIYVGIDLKSGHFHVECEDIEKAIPIWDDLFYTRGLNEKDISNLAIAAQYIIMRREREGV